MSEEDSNYVCTLDKASIKKAKDELNEIPEDRLAAVQALRTWIQEQPHIQYPATDTLTMLMYLRGCKFSQVKAREKIEENLRIRVNFPKWTKNVDARKPVFRAIAESGYFVALPKRTPDGCQIVLNRLASLHKLLGEKQATMADITQFGQIFMYAYLNKSETIQVNGVVFICDFSGVTASLITKLMNKESGKLKKAWQKASPGRFKGFHYYRAGLFFETLMSFYRPFMSKKWIDRIKLHDTMESIYEHIPKECLPAEFLPDDYTGPNAGTLDEIIKKFTATIFTEEVINQVLYRSGDAFTIDDSKRPSAEEVAGHFRKLNVD